MDGKNILVTGGAGYIGSHAVVQLAKKGYNPIILDNFSNSHPWILENIEALCARKLDFIEGDCTDEKTLISLGERFPEIEGIIHFAAFKAVGESVEKPLKYYQNNINALTQVLSFAEKFNIEHLVFSSSCTVYGEPDNIPVAEDAPLQEAISPYGYTKQVGERILMDLARSGSKIKTGILRYFNPIGAHESGIIGELPMGVPNNLVPYLSQVASGKRECLSIFGNDYPTDDGTCIRDYIHVVDLANAHIDMLKFLESGAESNPSIFNIGTGKGHSVLELVQTFEEENQIKLNYTFAPRRPGDVVKIYADNTLAKEKLEWEARYAIQDALKHVWKWEQYLGTR
jgi:UDP-glucose 4-epimerase